MGKGSNRRQPQISKELEELRWGLALGIIDLEEYKKRVAKLSNK